MKVDKVDILKELDPHMQQIVADRKRRVIDPLELLARSGGIDPEETDPLKIYEPISKDFEYWDKEMKDNGVDAQPALVAFQVGLLTEDNLPSYTHQQRSAADGHVGFSSWSNVWTSEERAHSDVLEQYGIASGILRGEMWREYIKSRTSQLREGIEITYTTPETIFPYVSVQEWATYRAHRNLGRVMCKSAGTVLNRIAGDEVSHHEVYVEVCKKALDIDSETMLGGIARVFKAFEMPGKKGIPRFSEHAKVIQASRIFGLADVFHSMKKCVDTWRIDQIHARSDEAKKAQEAILEEVSDRKIARIKQIEERLTARLSERYNNGLKPLLLS